MKRIFIAVFLLAFILAAPSAFAAEEGYADFPEKYQKLETLTDDTIVGIDMTKYQVQKNDWGKVLKDHKGKELSETEVFSFLRSSGINTVSVMITAGQTGDYSLDKQKETIRLARKAGLKTNAVLTFSDELTYKGCQTLPGEWAGDNAQDMAAKHAQDVLERLTAEGLAPDMVTVGNEINYDFLGYTGDDAWKSWEALAKVTGAIRQKAPDVMKIAVSFAAPDKAEDVKWLVTTEANSLNKDWCRSEYDYLSLTYYPWQTDTGYAEDMEYIRDLKAAYADNQISGTGQPLLLSCSIPCVSEFTEESGLSCNVPSQMDGLYELMETMDPAGGMIWADGIVAGGWSALFAEDGTASPALGVIDCAVSGQTDAVIDPYQFGGDQGVKDIPVSIPKIDGMAQNSIRGVDISSCAALAEAGVRFYDSEGNTSEADPLEPLFDALADNGVNYVRIRIWNDPKDAEGNTYGGGANDVEKGLEIARKAGEHDMKVLLCFHYSDFWADPQQQLLPKSWAKDAADPAAIEDHIAKFTEETVKQFQETGADIGMIQIGNEITRGMAGVHGTWKDVWTGKASSEAVCGYLKAGIQAARQEAPDALIALHLESPDVAKYSLIMDTWEKAGLDYDVLGTSCYRFWETKTKSQTPENLKKIVKLAADKGKLCCVLETCWPYTLKDGDGTPNKIGDTLDLSAAAVSPQGQVDAVTGLYESMVSQENGLGIFYWEPAWIPVKTGWIHWKYNKDAADFYGTGWASKGAVGYFNERKLYYKGEPAWGGSSWDNNALFDLNGHPMKSLAMFKDTISKGEEEIFCLQPVDDAGKTVGPASYVKVELGSKKAAPLPKVTGYEPVSAETTVDLEGKEAGVTKIEVVYKALAVYKGQLNVRGGNTYKVTKVATSRAKGTVTLVKGAKKKTVTIPATIRLADGKTYQVTGISARAFAKGKAVTLVVKTKKLTKARVKQSLRSSKVKTVKVKVGSKKANKSYVRKYKKIFTKSNCGKKVRVR